MRNIEKMSDEDFMEWLIETAWYLAFYPTRHSEK